MDAIVAASTQLRYRPSAAQLSASFGFRDVRPLLRGDVHPVELDPQFWSIRDELEKGDPSPARLHALGVSYLLGDDVPSAVRILERAVTTESGAEGGVVAAIRRSTNAALLNDLTAAWMASIERTGDTALRAQMLEAIQRAWSQEKSSPVAWTRAVVIESFHVREQSVAAWRDYLALGPQPEWTDRARERLRNLQQPSDAQAWPSIRDRLTAMPSDAPELPRLVDRFRQEVRLWCEDELLPQWGESVLSGDPTATLRLERIRALARALPEREVIDAVAAIARADRPALERLARGHAAFGAGRRADRTSEAAEAVRQMDVAINVLTPELTPFAWRARTEHAAVIYLSNDYPRARDELQRMPLDATSKACQGKVHALLGIIAVQNGSYKEAEDHYVRAAEAFRSIGERDYEATMISRLAAAMELAGDETLARRYREQSLELLDSTGDPKHRHDAMLEAAYAAMGKDQHAAAELFLDTLVAADTASRNLVTACASLMRRCDYRYRRGLRDAATEDLRDALRICGSIADPAVRERQSANLELAEAALGINAQSTDTVAGLDDAIAYYTKTNSHVWLPTAYFARARVLEERDPEAAERDFRAALGEMDSMREKLDDRKVRMSFTATTDEIVDGYVEFLLRQRRGRDAFEAADRHRVRELIDSPSARWRVDADSTQSSTALQAALPPGTVLIEYRILTGSMVAWVVTRTSLIANVLPGSLADLQPSVAAFDTDATDIVVKTSGAFLYDRLLRPIESLTGDASTLVIVPDDNLERVPYSALYDQRRNRRVVDAQATVIVPSAALFIASQERARERAGDRVMVIEAGDGGGSYAALPGASAESQAIARLYPGTQIIDATSTDAALILRKADDAAVLQFAGHTTVAADASAHSLRLGASDAQIGMSDILAAPFPRLRLAYLSACATESGPVLKSEGSVTIARSFFAAGVPIVVGTLWPVDDAIAQLAAQSFHEHLRSGDSPAEALRQAQLEVLRHSSRSRADWAAFRVIGAGI